MTSAADQAAAYELQTFAPEHPQLWAEVTEEAKARFVAFPSHYANTWAKRVYYDRARASQPTASQPQAEAPADLPVVDVAGAPEPVADVTEPDRPTLTPEQSRRPEPPPQQEAIKAFVTTAHGKTLITAPVTIDGGWQRALTPNPHMLWLAGRLVGAETPNRNGALWSAGDLQMGQPTVAHGPVNWLHEARHVIGSIAEARFIPGASDPTEAAAAAINVEDRKKMAKNGVALPDGSFPIPDVAHLTSAIRLARTPEQRRHVIKRARALGRADLIPESWRSDGTYAAEAAASPQSAAETRDPHIVTAASVWRWIYPDEATVIEWAAEKGQLWQSMECISESVICTEDHGGCGRQVSYIDYIHKADAACDHMREGSGVRRFADPTFLGTGIIVPPTRPGWADADVTVLRDDLTEAAKLSEKAYAQMGNPDIPAATFEQMMAQVIRYAGS